MDVDGVGKLVCNGVVIADGDKVRMGSNVTDGDETG